MQKTWKPTVAGILNIISAAGGLFALLGLIVSVIVLGNQTAYYFIPSFGPLGVGMELAVLFVIMVCLAIVGILPLLGGIYALKRRKWGWALAGAIVTIFSAAIFGILATIFIVLAREEFE